MSYRADKTPDWVVWTLCQLTKSTFHLLKDSINVTKLVFYLLESFVHVTESIFHLVGHYVS